MASIVIMHVISATRVKFYQGWIIAIIAEPNSIIYSLTPLFYCSTPIDFDLVAIAPQSCLSKSLSLSN